MKPARTSSLLAAILLGCIAAPTTARAEPAIVDAAILDKAPPAVRVESVTMRITAFEQNGQGYQSQAGPVDLGPGSERLTVFQPQVEVVVKQGDRLTHRVWLPLDVVSAASPAAIDKSPVSADIVSNASRRNVAGALDWTTVYKADKRTDYFARSGFHLEENFRSWNVGLGASRSFAEDNAVVSGSANAVFDIFDRFDFTGHRHGRAQRSANNLNLGLTQLLTPTTVAHVNYGITVQRGELGNTWNSVPLDVGYRNGELLPDLRIRHAAVARVAQFLPWNGALKAFYRFYADDWGIRANTLETQIHQRLTPWLYLRGIYRVHDQRGADFFTVRASSEARLRTADSDLQTFVAQTWGLAAAADLPFATYKSLHFDVGYERYFRSNGLSVNIVTWATGFRF